MQHRCSATLWKGRPNSPSMTYRRCPPAIDQASRSFCGVLRRTCASAARPRRRRQGEQCPNVIGWWACRGSVLRHGSDERRQLQAADCEDATKFGDRIRMLVNPEIEHRIGLGAVDAQSGGLLERSPPASSPASRARIRRSSSGQASLERNAWAMASIVSGQRACCLGPRPPTEFVAPHATEAGRNSRRWSTFPLSRART